MSNTDIEITEWFSLNESVEEDTCSDSNDEVEENKKKDKELVIYIFGKNADNENVSIRIKDFPCYFYILLPEKWTVNGKTNNYKVSQFIDKLKAKLSYSDQNSFIGHEIQKKKKFYGFTNNDKYAFIRLKFKNTIAMRNCSEIFIKKNKYKGNVLSVNVKDGITKIQSTNTTSLKEGDLLQFNSYKTRFSNQMYEILRINKDEINIKGKVPLSNDDDTINWVMTKGDGSSVSRKPIYNVPGLLSPLEKVYLYESNIDPMLRFLHIKQIKPCGWVSIPSDSIMYDKKTTAKHEYCIKWTDIESISKAPTVPINTLAYDIECTSSHGDFPRAIKNYTKLSKDLLELKNYKLETIQQLLNVIPNKKFTLDNDVVNRLYLKDKRWISDEVIEELSKKIKIYIWLRDKARYIRKNHNITISNEELSKNLFMEPTDNIDFDYITTLCDVIPTLSISRKQGFCNWNVNENEYTIAYTDTKDPNIFVEQSLIALLDENLPPLKGDRCIQIGCCFLKQGDKNAYRKILLLLGGCSNFDKNVEIIYYSDNDSGEKQMLLEFSKILIEEDPEIITGYNTFGFDWPYLFDRASELGILDKFSQLSRLVDRECKMVESNSKRAKGKYVDIPGRVNLDLLKTIQGDHNLVSYKLDNVASTFIRGNVKKYEVFEELGKTIIHTDNTIGLQIGNYIQLVLEKGYDEDKLENGKKFEIIDLSEKELTISGKIQIEGDIKCHWSLGKDDVTPEEIFAAQRGSDDDRARVGKYCIMDVVLCLELMNKLRIVTNNVGMSNVCTTPLSWIFRRGQGIKILSLVSKECRDKGYLLPTLFPDTYGDDSYEGAIVLTPYPGIYLDDEPVSVLDYASLYPNSMRANNLSHETLVKDEKWLGDKGKVLLKSLGYNCVDITYDNYKGAKDKKVKTGICHVRFVQPKNNKFGIIPSILKNLLTARKLNRTRIVHKKYTLQDNTTVEGLEDFKDDDTIKVKEDNGNIVEIEKSNIISVVDRYSDFDKEVFDALQLAYKITANSLYGQIGARTSSVYWKEIAAATTATGREQLYIAKNFIENEYEGSKIVYGDTDSVFVRFNMVDANGNKLKGKEALKESIRLGVDAGKRISKILKSPQDLEYEKTFSPFILISKKRYLGYKYEFDVNKHKLTSMGIVLKRRDNATILKIIYGGVIDIIMKEMKIVPAIDFLQKSLRNLISGKIGLDKLVITKTLNDGYKNPEMIAHKVLADRMGERDPGNKPQLFDRIEYVYKQTKGNVKLQGDRIENPKYMLENNIKPDYEFYVTNQIMKPVSQIFALRIEEIPTFKQHKDYYNNKLDKLTKNGISQENAIKKISNEKQKDTEELLFWDILYLCESHKTGTQSIKTWFS